MRTRLRRNAPAIVLYLLSPVVGELLSGSSPPREFFSSFSLIVVVGLYGAGALLAREATRGWGKGYPTLLCLGAAYGIFEEGLVCKSFFDPHWMDLGLLGTHGRALGTNWVWAVWLTLYHMTVSIAVPVMLAEVLFPARRSEPWLGRTWRAALVVLLLLIALLGYFALTKFRPPWPHYLLTWAAVLGLIALARRIPARLGRIAGPRPARLWRLWAVGFLWTLLSYLAFGGLPRLHTPAPLTVLAGLAVTLAAGWSVLRLSGNLARWDDRGRFALGAGLLSFFVLLAPLQELDPERTDAAGMTAVGITALALLLLARWGLWRKTAPARLPDVPVAVE
jgi:hypothetical protein